MRTLREEVAALKRRLSTGQGGRSGIDFPPAEFLASPLVIASGASFSACRARASISPSRISSSSLNARSRLPWRWKLPGSGRTGIGCSWCGPRTADGGRDQNIVLVAKKTVTPSRNTVTEIIRLNIDGNDAPDALLLTLFRQLKTVFNG